MSFKANRENFEKALDRMEVSLEAKAYFIF